MANKVQLTIGGQNIYPITDVSVVAGLEQYVEEHSVSKVIDISDGLTSEIRSQVQDAPGSILLYNGYYYVPQSGPDNSPPTWYNCFEGDEKDFHFLNINWNTLDIVDEGDIAYATTEDLALKANINSPTFTGVPKAPTAASGTNTTQIATTAFVSNAISNIPKAMQFKGSLGTGGTITSLPAADSSNSGWTYKVITAGTYAGQAAKVGDLFISTGLEWILIPSGDEPSGTVTSIATGIGLTGGTITSSGSIKAKLKDETLNSADSSKSTSTSGGLYSIEADKSGNLAVRVPWIDTKNTAGSTDTSSKIFLIGATSQAANPQTYSDNEVYATSGVLTTKSVQVGGTSATMQYNSTLEAIEFTFS